MPVVTPDGHMTVKCDDIGAGGTEITTKVPQVVLDHPEDWKFNWLDNKPAWKKVGSEEWAFPGDDKAAVLVPITVAPKPPVPQTPKKVQPSKTAPMRESGAGGQNTMPTPDAPPPALLSSRVAWTRGTPYRTPQSSNVVAGIVVTGVAMGLLWLLLRK